MNKSGFTLIEMMVVIAIAGILTAIAVPKYNTYQKRSRFTEVVLAASAYKLPASIAVQSGKITNVDDLNSGKYGIPGKLESGQSASPHVESVSIDKGKIRAIGTAAFENAVFEMQATITPSSQIVWTINDKVTDSCQSKGYC